ncbi:MAG: DNA polymerase III subunit gamma/tau [Candidatus Levybacteria bacterium]|nr:DNA polymerase III subunit gamma/tau [Candidatus Levybacteria bacterium]
MLFSKSIPHAFFFTGPKGLGKTSSARIVAKAVNCEERNQESGIRNKGKIRQLADHNSSFIIPNSKDIEPCNQCPQCISITNGSNIDVLEIDGASNRGIDEIRDLREKIRLSPVSAAKKVYIIDEVHMLTTEAFNALLKTLEEPPSHALFVLCTTEPHKVPATITSRCFHVAFSRATTDELIRSLSRIVKAEQLDISEDALKLIAARADGSFRDAAKSLEEIVLASSDGKLTKPFIEGKLKTVNIESHIESLLLALQEKDAKKALAVVDTIANQETDMKFVIEELVDVLHRMLLAHVGVVSDKSTAQFSLEEIKSLVTLLTKAYQDLRFAVIEQLPLELAVIEFVQQAKIFADQDADKRGKMDQRQSAFRSASISDKAVINTHTNNNQELLRKLIENIKMHNHSLAGVLRGCVVQKQEDRELVLATSFTFHKERLEDTKAIGILEKAAYDVLGKKVSVSIVLNK